MKRKGFLLFIVLFASLFIVGCGEKEEVTLPTIAVDTASYTMKVADQVTITHTIGETTEELEVVYTSDNTNVATVANGVVTAKAVGTANIKVSLKDYPDIFKMVAIIVDGPILTLTGPDSVIITKTIQLVATDANSSTVNWESLNTEILTVDENGLVTGVNGGTATIKISSKVTTDFLEKEITVIIPEPEQVEIKDAKLDKVSLFTKITLEAIVTPLEAPQNVIWTSSDELVASIDETGKITIYEGGEVTITATVDGHDIKAEVTFTVVPKPMEIIQLMNVDNPIAKNITVTGFEVGGTYQYNLYTSVSSFLYNTPLNIIQKIIPELGDNDNRPGIIKANTYITVHDTASAAATGTALAHSNYVVGGGGGTSWHFTVGNDGIFQQLPTNETAYHAGDGSNTYGLNKTGVLASNKNPVVDISPDGYYTLDGIKTIEEAPTKDGIILTAASFVDSGIHVEIGNDGYYYIGNTYFNKTYQRISNGGGNRNSIGIESCINKGSDVYLTWHYIAKLVAKLMIEENVKFENVVQHNFFSGKNCPQTMREAGMWENFKQLVRAEYLAAKYLKDYTVTFSTMSEFIDNRGRVINLPALPEVAFFSVEVTDNLGVSTIKTFSVNLPAKLA